MTNVNYKPRECFNNVGMPKMAYRNKSEAKISLKRMEFKTSRGTPMQRNAQIYKCSVCKFHHIGHK